MVRLAGPAWFYVPVAAVILLKLPLLVLFAILWRSDATLSVSKRLRYWALGAAGVHTLSAAPQAYWWFRSLAADWPGLQWSQGGAAFRTIWEWAATLNLGREFWNAAAIFANVAFVLFLIAVFRHRDETSQAGARQSRLLRETAALATGAAGLSVLWLLAAEPFAAIAAHNQWRSPWLGPQMLRLYLGNAWQLVQVACSVVAPLAIYRMQPPASTEPESEPASPRMC
jgi:hypothetical protein